MNKTIKNIDKEIQTLIKRVLIDFKELSLMEISRKVKVMLDMKYKAKVMIGINRVNKNLQLIPKVNSYLYSTNKKVTVGIFTITGFKLVKKPEKIRIYYLTK